MRGAVPRLGSPPVGLHHLFAQVYSIWFCSLLYANRPVFDFLFCSNTLFGSWCGVCVWGVLYHTRLGIPSIMLVGLCPWLWPDLGSLPACVFSCCKLEAWRLVHSQSWQHRTCLLLGHFRNWKLHAHILQVDWKWNCLPCPFYLQTRFWNLELLGERYLVPTRRLYQQYGVTLVPRPISHYPPTKWLQPKALGECWFPEEQNPSFQWTDCLFPAPCWCLSL